MKTNSAAGPNLKTKHLGLDFMILEVFSSLNDCMDPFGVLPTALQSDPCLQLLLQQCSHGVKP